MKGSIVHPNYRSEVRVLRVAGMRKRLRKLEEILLDEETNLEAEERVAHKDGTSSYLLMEQTSTSSNRWRERGRERGSSLNFKQNLLKEVAHTL